MRNSNFSGQFCYIYCIIIRGTKSTLSVIRFTRQYNHVEVEISLCSLEILLLNYLGDILQHDY